MTDAPTVIALVPLAGGGGRIGVVEAGPPHEERRADGLDPPIADLIDVGLYDAGRVARAAVRRLRPKRAGFRLMPHAPAPVALSPVDVSVFDGLAPENASSAELPLALAMLMRERGRGDAVVAATGALEGTGAAAARFEDAPIHAVGGIDEKFDALSAFLERRRPGPWSDALTLVTPVFALDGTPFAEAHAEPLAKLRDRAAAVGVRLDHAPTASLREAADRLGATAAPRHPRETAAWFGLSAAALGAGLVTAAAVWAATPTELRFAPLDFNGLALATPLRTIYDHQTGAGAPLPLCRSADGRARIGWGEEVTLVAETAPTAAPASAFSALIVLVSEQGQVKLFPGDALPEGGRPARAEGGGVRFGGRFPVTAEARGDAAESDRVLIAALARKLRPFDIEAMEMELLAMTAREAPERRLNAALRIVSEKAAAHVSTIVETSRSLDGCYVGG